MRTASWCIAVLVIACPVVSALENLELMPDGKTPLNDLVYYQVGYQSYDGDVKHMPPGWTGHFDPATGVTYSPGERMLGREALLIHSPWRIPPGRTWADFPMRLPEGKPITLRFGIAMRPESMEPDRSDGVTFSAYVIEVDAEHELLREHYALGKWKDYEFDLSAYAGKNVWIRLQVEPGPENNPGWDHSHFSEAAIIVGSEDDTPSYARDMMHLPALQATANASLVALSNNPSDGVIPSNLVRYTNRVEQDGFAYRFWYEGEDGEVVYTYRPDSGTLDDFIDSASGQVVFRPAAGGGVSAVRQVRDREEFVPLRGGTARTVELGKDNVLTVNWEYPFDGATVDVTWRFGIQGKALTVAAECSQPVLSGLSLGHAGDTPFRKVIQVPYLNGSVQFLPAQFAFVSRYLDWTQSHGSACPQGEATYEPKTDGTRNPLKEFGYIAVSPNVNEVLPNLPHPASSYLDLLGPRIMLDIWQHHDGTYVGDAENLLDLKDNGVDHLAIISHVWQHFGYDVKLPDHLPANPQFGGDEGMIEFGKAANECGYVWSLHENYIDMYPDAPSYDPTARPLLADGSPSLGWYNAGTGVQAFGIKCTRELGFAKQNSPIIHERYGTNAAYLDVHTCVHPWHQLDHDSAEPMAAMMSIKIEKEKELFQYERDTHGGPLFGEGNNHFYWAGLVDGTEAQVSGGEDHAAFLDFDLLKLHPQMVNHGMGYYERWFRRGYDHQWGFDTGTVQQIDKYRAQEIAYGHAGFIGAAQTDNVQWVAKEHHMMHPIQRLANMAKPTTILYEVDGQLAPASVALVAGQRTRQRISYDSGLTVWVNWDKAPWEIEGRVLPQWGVLALGPDTVVETALRDGSYADYAECPEFVFCDARTSFHMPYLNREKDIEPRLESFEWLGGNRIRLRYAWNVNDRLDKDYVCFVHFTTPLIATADSIAFQGDHALPKATTEWNAGETVVDGPYEAVIPAEPIAEYNITIGLHKEGERVPLKGIATSGNRILIGKLLVERNGGEITNVRLGAIDAQVDASEVAKADFDAHMNPPDTWVDFGAIATEGSVKVNKGDRELVVFPYPREKAFTVAIDLARLMPGAPASAEGVRVTALAAGTQEEIGSVPYDVRDGRIAFTMGKRGAGRYRIRW
ncbi:MAG: hypothetical protein KJ060_04905 [Candidatus Hydrogenedentes bacterium]|nr:hypothetical protein [Candidatus Hydrogenedentota bacterium]